MRRYEVFYKDDFGFVVPAIDKQADDGEWVLYEDAQAEITQLRGNLSLAEEGLANYAQENQELKAALEHYGHHIHPNCHDLTLNADGSFGPRNGCLCGFDAACSPTPQTAEHERKV